MVARAFLQQLDELALRREQRREIRHVVDELNAQPPPTVGEGAAPLAALVEDWRPRWGGRERRASYSAAILAGALSTATASA